MKTICIDCFSNLPVPAVKGGAVQTLYTMLMDENEKQHKLNLIIVSCNDKEAEKESNKYKYSKVIYVKKNDFIKRIYNRIVSFPNYDEAVENSYIKKVKADYYLTCGNGSHYYPVVKKFGIDRVIFHVHTEVKATIDSDKVFKKALGVSNYVTDTYYKYSKWDRSNGRTVHNCTDEDQIKRELTQKEKKEFRETLGLEQDDFVVLYTGRIIDVKGVKELVEAINSIDDKNIKLLICGGVNSAIDVVSEYQKDIFKAADKSGGRIICTGYINHDELYKYYDVSDIQVIPSLWEEAAGLVVVEGMYKGLPLIITDSGGMSEYASSECAITIKRDDMLIESMAENIVRLKDNAELRIMMGKAGCEKAKEFTKKRFYEEFVKVFDEWN